MPRPAREPDRELARPIRTQPENATAHPARSRRGEAFLEEDPGQDRDHDRADVDQHGRRAGVDAAFGLVQRDAVDAEKQHAEGDDPQQVAPPGQRFAPQSGRGAEHDQADQQPAERQRARGQPLAGVADGDER